MGGHLQPPGESAGAASEAQGSATRKESEQQGIRTAEKLLRDFYPLSASGQTQLRLLQSLCLLTTREKANVEAALGAFLEIAQAEVCQLGWGCWLAWRMTAAKTLLPPLPNPCVERQCPCLVGHGTGLRAAEADPQGAHAAEAAGQGPVDTG